MKTYEIANYISEIDKHKMIKEYDRVTRRCKDGKCPMAYISGIQVRTPSAFIIAEALTSNQILLHPWHQTYFSASEFINDWDDRKISDEDLSVALGLKDE